MKNTKDESFMHAALGEARRALEEKEVPIGAVVVCLDTVLSRAHNRTIRLNDPSAHAEILAIREACQMRKNHRIPDCELYVTIEPCAMCLGAAVQARLKRIVFGTLDPKGGAVRSIMQFPVEKTNHNLNIEGGILANECGLIMKEFFATKRK